MNAENYGLDDFQIKTRTEDTKTKYLNRAEQLIKRAKKQNLHTMIGVIDSENTNSIDFHKKFGFEEVGFIKESGFKFNRWLHSVFVQKML